MSRPFQYDAKKAKILSFFFFFITFYFHFLFATLPCETLISAKQAVNNKLQGSVAAYLRCGGVINNQIEKGLLLSLRVKRI